MKVYKEETYTGTRKIEDKIVCDWCGKEGKFGRWDSTLYEVNDTAIEVEIHAEKGKSYPDGAWITKTSIDLCPECFKRMCKLLSDNGCNINEKEIGW